jgi:hypothetical protein
MKVKRVATNVLKECGAFIFRVKQSSIFRVNPEDGGSMFLHNFGAYVPCSKTSHPKKP